MNISKSLFVAGILSTATLAAASWADDLVTYNVTITNLTPGQPIAPVMATTHSSSVSFFQVGAAPSSELADLAEAGDGKPMAAKLLTTPGVSDAQVASAGIAPGGSITLSVTAHNAQDRLSLGAMLANTNDAFVAISNVALPNSHRKVIYTADAYDAGTETNDEACVTVPGPACGGAALSPEDSGEGFVYIHNGIHGIGGLSAAEYDWRNPVAQITIERAQ